MSSRWWMGVASLTVLAFAPRAFAQRTAPAPDVWRARAETASLALTVERRDETVSVGGRPARAQIGLAVLGAPWLSSDAAFATWSSERRVAVREVATGAQRAGSLGAQWQIAAAVTAGASLVLHLFERDDRGATIAVYDRESFALQRAFVAPHRCRHVLAAGAKVVCVVERADGERGYAWAMDTSNAQRAATIWPLGAPGSTFGDAALSSDAAVLVVHRERTTRGPAALLALDLQRGVERSLPVPGRRDDGVRSIEFDPSNANLAVGTFEGNLHVIASRSGAVLRSAPRYRVERNVAALDASGALWDDRTNLTVTPARGAARSLLSPCGTPRRLRVLGGRVVAVNDGSICVLDANTGALDLSASTWVAADERAQWIGDELVMVKAVARDERTALPMVSRVSVSRGAWLSVEHGYGPLLRALRSSATLPAPYAAPTVAEGTPYLQWLDDRFALRMGSARPTLIELRGERAIGEIGGEHVAVLRSGAQFIDNAREGLRLRSTATGEVVRVLSARGAYEAPTVSPDDRYVVGLSDGWSELFDLSTQRARELRGPLSRGSAAMRVDARGFAGEFAVVQVCHQGERCNSRVLRVATSDGRVIETWSFDDRAVRLAYAPTGDALAVLFDGRIELRSVR